MAAAAIALEGYQGEDKVFVGTHRVSSGGAVVDITGWTLLFTLKRKATDTATLLSIAGVLLSPTAGTYTVSLTAAQLAALDVGDYHCDVWRTNAGAKTELAIGTFALYRPVRTAA